MVRIVFDPRKRNPCSTYVTPLSRTPESFFPLFNLNEVCICNHYSGRAPRTLHWKGYLMTLGFVVVLADFKTNPTMVSQEVCIIITLFKVIWIFNCSHRSPHSEALAHVKRSNRSTMGNRTGLSMHPRNFGCYKIDRPYVRPYVDVKGHTY